MDTRDMIVSIVAIAAGTVVLLSPAACTMNRQNRVKEVIAAGVDPTSAKCAVEADSGMTAECILAAAKRQEAKRAQLTSGQ